MDKVRITENISETKVSVLNTAQNLGMTLAGLFLKSRSEHIPGLSARKAEIHIEKESRQHQASMFP